MVAIETLLRNELQKYFPIPVGMGFYAGDGFEFVYYAVTNLMEFPNLFEPIVQERRTPFEFFTERALISKRRKQMVEHLVVSDDAFVRRTSLETENFIAQSFGIFRFEPDSFLRSEKYEKRSKKNGGCDYEEYGEI